MPQITLGRQDVLKLAAFCRIHFTHPFVAKDQGAYIGAATSPTNQCIWYFEGCDPTTDGWYDKTRELFGGDDFGEFVPVDWLEKVERDPTITRMIVKIDEHQLAAEFMRR